MERTLEYGERDILYNADLLRRVWVIWLFSERPDKRLDDIAANGRLGDFSEDGPIIFPLCKHKGGDTFDNPVPI